MTEQQRAPDSDGTLPENDDSADAAAQRVTDLIVAESMQKLLDAGISSIDSAGVEANELIGVGSYANVYSGCIDDQPVAVKVLYESLRDADAIAKLAQEILLQNEVSTAPDIVGADLRRFLFAMHRVFGRTIDSTMLQTKTPRDRFMLGAQCIEAVAGVTDAGMVHRDVKPKNLIQGGGDDDRVFIVDFGHAIRAGDTDRAGALALSLGYGAPEQALYLGEKLTVQTDVYGLGATLFQLLHPRNKTLMDLTSAESLQERRRVIIRRRGYDENITDVAKMYGFWRRRSIRHLLHNCLAQEPERRWTIATLKTAWNDIARKI